MACGLAYNFSIIAPDLRSATKSKEEAVLGDKAVGGTDDDKDHTPNVASGLKA